MPVDDPQFGEIWSTTNLFGRPMQGIISDVNFTRIVLVSLTGNRTAVPHTRLSRSGTWRFVQEAPRRILPRCVRVDCTENGMLTYIRTVNEVSVTEYACPRHAPLAPLVSEYTTNYEVPEIPPEPIEEFLQCRSTPCMSCGNKDPAEDMRFAFLPARLWSCVTCPTRWITFPKQENAIDTFINAAMFFSASTSEHRIALETEELTILDGDVFRGILGREETIRRNEDRSITFHGLHTVFQPNAFYEKVRAHFAAVLKVRTHSYPPATAPIQRLGGSPNRGGVVGSPVLPDRSNDAPNAAPRIFPRVPAPKQEAEDSFAGVVIEKKSQWVQRQSGDIMVVSGLIQATDKSDVVEFRRASEEGIEPLMRLNRRDFLLNHKLYEAGNTTMPARPAAPQIVVGEEWESRDGNSIIVREVDNRKEVVYGEDLKNNKRRQIPFVQFRDAGRWRRVVRKSLYQRLSKPEIGEE